LPIIETVSEVLGGAEPKGAIEKLIRDLKIL
jgi:hypothetical protein